MTPARTATLTPREVQVLHRQWDPPRRTLTDDEIVQAYTNSLTNDEAAAFLAGLGWGLGNGPTWIADTVRRLLPGRLAKFEEPPR